MVGDMGWVLGPLVLSLVAQRTGPIEGNLWPFLAVSVWLATFGFLLVFARDPVTRSGREARILANGKV